MSFRTTAILLVLLAIAAGVVWYTGQMTSAEPSADSTATPSVLSFAVDDVQRIEVSKGEQRTVLERTGPNEWQLTAPENTQADAPMIQTRLSNLGNLDATRVVEENATSLSDFGLDAPSFTIKVELNNGQTHELLVGKETPTGVGTYAKLADRPAVYLVSTFELEQWSQFIDEPPKYVPPTPVATETPAATEATGTPATEGTPGTTPTPTADTADGELTPSATGTPAAMDTPAATATP